MEYIQKIVNSYSRKHIRKVPEKYEPLMSIVREPNISQSGSRKGYYYDQMYRVIEIIQETKNTISSLYANYDSLTKDEKEIVRNNVSDIRQECIEYIDKITCSEGTMYLLLKAIEKNKELSRFIFEILFGTPNKQFFKMIIDSKEDLSELVEWKNGNIQLYDFLFYKQKVV